MAKKASMFVPCPSPEALVARGMRKRAVDEMYELYAAAHGEAMELAARLPGVFGDPPRPRITLHVARGYDDEWILSDERISELAALDPEAHWMEVSSEAVNEIQEYFCFTDAEGCRFYLPAFLRHFLAEFPMCRYHAVCYACQQRLHFELLTPEQLRFTEDFLALCRTWDVLV